MAKRVLRNVVPLLMLIAALFSAMCISSTRCIEHTTLEHSHTLVINDVAKLTVVHSADVGMCCVELYGLSLMCWECCWRSHVSRLVLSIDVRKYWRLWMEENRDLIHASWCWRSASRGLRVVNAVRRVDGVPMILEIPLPKGLLCHDSPTYLKHALIPALRAALWILNASRGPALAEALKSFVESLGYNPYMYTRFVWEHILAFGGVCYQWSMLGYELGKAYGLRVVILTDPAGIHEAAFLCEPWWRSRYRIDVVLDNGSVIHCSLWIDTGYGARHWNTWRPTTVVASTISAKIVDVKPLGAAKTGPHKGSG